MKVISYYELLKMIKDGNIPQKVNYKITGYLEEYVEYTAQYDRNDFTHYELTNHHREDENIHFYLNENYLESDMYDDSILILEEPKKIPEKLDHLISYDIQQFDDLKEYVEITTSDLFGKVNKIIDTLNQLSDYLKSKGE